MGIIKNKAEKNGAPDFDVLDDRCLDGNAKLLHEAFYHNDTRAMRGVMYCYVYCVSMGAFVCR